VLYSFLQSQRNSFERVTSKELTTPRVTAAVRDGLLDGTLALFDPTNRANRIESCIAAVEENFDVPGLNIVVTGAGLRALHAKVDLEGRVRGMEQDEMRTTPESLRALQTLPYGLRSKVLGAGNMHRVLQQVRRVGGQASDASWRRKFSVSPRGWEEGGVEAGPRSSPVFIFNHATSFGHQAALATPLQIRHACDVRIAQLERTHRLGLLPAFGFWRELCKVPHVYQGMVTHKAPLWPQYEEGAVT